ncbi:SDR family oxidoreductase [Colwellia sp. 1_MG-2023]|uniref:SDR family oxidoreductase n=1 Tax=unclassified Colwellia TaxID=196834 RepID=UPI001C09740F|nr:MULTISPECIES: SDR family oxidoreductase [unclassified Colwellia]MBU2923350.1 SDR family oxidoreductase [Colwellia sp. C2M11]MDO6653663.1 SDR family oxidoreductase [Colwellia sp. 3_MG-2023]MDO6666474.1 SDR family oxidoreductase [Colwellia sp. 2_MG-2023]MDO6690891.1 SDR family oxidoreductase [Colwellia sp. 1_MG-2023]
MCDKKSVAIITGSSRGIGAAIAIRLASDGFSVVVNFANNEKEALKIVHKIEQLGGSAVAIQADVSNAKEVAHLFEETEAIYGQPDVLINSAGIMYLSPIAEYSDELFDKTVAVNLKGTFNTLREASNKLKDGGRIVNLSTSVIGLNLPTYSVYAATKAAVETMTAILSKEMRGRSITVNSVAPGPTATALFLDGKSNEQIEALAKMNPLERLAEPTDIANTVSFLVSYQGGWLNGQTLRANGGMV